MTAAEVNKARLQKVRRVIPGSFLVDIGAIPPALGTATGIPASDGAKAFDFSLYVGLLGVSNARFHSDSEQVFPARSRRLLEFLMNLAAYRLRAGKCQNPER